MCELFFLTIRSSLYTHFLALRKSKITHRFWAFAQFIRAMCPARINVFLNCCRRRLLGIKRTANNWKRTRLDVLRKQCRLVAPLELIASRRLAFVARVLTRPSCLLSRQMLFAKVVPGQTATAVISGRSRPSYLNLLHNWQLKSSRRSHALKGSHSMGDKRILLKPRRDDSFKKVLSNEPNFGRIHLAGQYLTLLNVQA